ncbi:MAG: MFS transporter [archaeon]
MVSKKKAKKTLWIFSVAAFLNDVGSDMIMPIWPLFVTTFLGADLTILGLLDGLGKAFVSISQAVSGYVSDRIRKRKVFVWVGYLFAGFARGGYALVNTWPWLVPLKILDRSGKIRDAPRDAIIADISKYKSRGKFFGILEMMDNLGAIVGILISIAVFSLLGFKKLFLLAAIPSLIAVILIIFFIKEKHDGKIFKGLKIKNLDFNFKLFLFVSGIFALANFSYSFLLVFANQFGIPTTFVPVFYLLYTVVATIAAIPFGKALLKLGRRSTITISFALFAVMCLGFILINQTWMLYILFILYGLHLASLNVSQKTIVSELAPKKYRASSLGLYQMVIGILALPSSVIAGVLWEKVAMWAPFALALGLTSIAIVVLSFVNFKNHDS